ncbi:Mitochondrial substrate carrier family protein N [Grifola frondosa]|uniref:Mitochondrial substrate carrier family protein N n=1 Tax=Grifola frondosa TaxID=5627 RepID=A0A1C7M5F6_GRIFR|nr:Mitochondrial substrate carrier family protein N [Grifola frondosa]
MVTYTLVNVLPVAQKKEHTRVSGVSTIPEHNETSCRSGTMCPGCSWALHASRTKRACADYMRRGSFPSSASASLLALPGGWLADAGARRQIPYAIGQFTVNEFCHGLAFRSMSEETHRTLTPGAKFGISLGSGIVAGFATAILSHRRDSFTYPCHAQPADTPLLQINKGHGPQGSMAYRLRVLAQQAGVRGLFAGLAHG